MTSDSSLPEGSSHSNGALGDYSSPSPRPTTAQMGHYAEVGGTKFEAPKLTHTTGLNPCTVITETTESNIVTSPVRRTLTPRIRNRTSSENGPIRALQFSSTLENATLSPQTHNFSSPTTPLTAAESAQSRLSHSSGSAVSHHRNDSDSHTTTSSNRFSKHRSERIRSFRIRHKHSFHAVDATGDFFLMFGACCFFSGSVLLLTSEENSIEIISAVFFMAGAVGLLLSNAIKLCTYLYHLAEHPKSFHKPQAQGGIVAASILVVASAVFLAASVFSLSSSATSDGSEEDSSTVLDTLSSVCFLCGSGGIFLGILVNLVVETIQLYKVKKEDSEKERFQMWIGYAGTLIALIGTILFFVGVVVATRHSGKREWMVFAYSVWTAGNVLFFLGPLMIFSFTLMMCCNLDRLFLDSGEKDR